MDTNTNSISGLGGKILETLEIWRRADSDHWSLQIVLLSRPDAGNYQVKTGDVYMLHSNPLSTDFPSDLHLHPFLPMQCMIFDVHLFTTWTYWIFQSTYKHTQNISLLTELCREAQDNCTDVCWRSVMTSRELCKTSLLTAVPHLILENYHVSLS